jgi:hypothetical protein
MNGVGGGWNERHPGELIRLARPTDADRQRTVERAAGARFLTVDMTAVAAEEPMSAETLAAYARSGRSWVATDRDDRVTGYVVVDVIDGCAHIDP